MANFTVNEILDPEDNPFDRHSRISWWSQEKVSNAKVMVVGAGAIGNETLKNLALLGVKNIFIVDFDEVSTSNLSRTVLFRKSDKGKKKAEIAAIRTKEMCLAEDVNIDWFHGDIVWELGTGVYREMDVVLGCLDNVETRFHLNRQCWLAETPWIDAGIYELGMHVTVFVPPNPPCYECGASKEQIKALRKRYSCDNFKRAMLSEGKMPTVQVASAIASAIQVQEAIKLICGQSATVGSKIYYQGKINDFDRIELPENHSCTAHSLKYPEIISIPLSNQISLRKLLEFISENYYQGINISLDLTGDRDFVVSATCRFCGDEIRFYKPSFRIFDTETICNKCVSNGVGWNNVSHEIETRKTIISEFNLLNTEKTILEKSLHEIGIPYFHIIAIKDQYESYKYFQLSGDRAMIIPNISNNITNLI